jgi:hypothetical protein
LPPIGSNELLDSPADVVSDAPHPLEGLPLRIREVPIYAAESGHERASLVAAHRHEKLGFPCELIGEASRYRMRQVKPDLAHDLDDFWMDVLARLCAC